MTSKHRITVGEELRYDVDLSGLHNLSGTYSQLWATPAASTTLTGTLAAWVVTAVDCTAGAGARTLPAANSVIAGTAVCAKKADASTNALVVSRAGADLIFGTGSGATSKTLSLAGEAVEFVSNGVDKWTIRASDTPSGALAATYVQAVVMPAATGVAATDAANFAAALAKVPTTGGVIQLLPTTATTYDFTSGVTIDRPVKLRGTGGSNGPLSAAAGNSATYGTRITSSSTTVSAITVTSDGCTFEDFALVNTATPTAGAGIAVTAGGAHTRYRGVTIGGFYRCFDHLVGHEWFMDGCVAYDFVKTGLRIKNPTASGDAGDMGVINSQFTAGPNNLAPQAAIEWCSGGGLRLVGCKTNHRGSSVLTLGLFLHPDDGTSTSVFTITGNSFENSNYGIYCDDTGNTGTGTIAKIAITGNEFLVGVNKCIAFARTSGGKLTNVTITGNVFTGSAATSNISLGNCDRISIANNEWGSNITTPLTITAGVTNLFLAPGFSFTTAARPAATIMRAGSTYYDTTLSKQAWSDGTNWKDATATNV